MTDILYREYSPVAVRFNEADCIEYATRDCAMIYERIDANLSIMRDMHTREIIGFQLNNWSKHVQDIDAADGLSFKPK